MYGATKSRNGSPISVNKYEQYLSAVAFAVTTFGTVALMSGFFLKPVATLDDYLANAVPLFGGFLSILGVSEIRISRLVVGCGWWADLYCLEISRTDIDVAQISIYT